MTDKPRVVIDTQLVLDWFVFDDPRVQTLAAHVESGALVWIACPRMRDELGHVLGDGRLARWRPDRERSLARFDAHAFMCATPPRSSHGLLCSDPDDQVFVDLAVGERASLLLTRDRALLRLARRAAARGLAIRAAV